MIVALSHLQLSIDLLGSVCVQYEYSALVVYCSLTVYIFITFMPLPPSFCVLVRARRIVEMVGWYRLQLLLWILLDLKQLIPLFFMGDFIILCGVTSCVNALYCGVCIILYVILLYIVLWCLM